MSQPASANLLTLPYETIEYTLLFAEPSALASLSRTCRFFYYFIHHSPDSHLWRAYFLQYFDDPNPTAGPSTLEPDFWRKEFCERWSLNRLFGYYHDEKVEDMREIISKFNYLLNSAAPARASTGPSRNIAFIDAYVGRKTKPWFFLQPRLWPLISYQPQYEYEDNCYYFQFILGRSNWTPYYTHTHYQNGTSDRESASSRYWHVTIQEFFHYPLLWECEQTEGPVWSQLRFARILAKECISCKDRASGGYKLGEIETLRNFYGGPPDADWAGVNGKWRLNFVHMLLEDYEFRHQMYDSWRLDHLLVCMNELELLCSYASSKSGPKSRSLDHSPLTIHGQRISGNDDMIGDPEDTFSTVSGRVRIAEHGTPRWTLKLTTNESPCSINLIGYQVGAVGSGAGVVGEWTFTDPEDPAPISHGCFWMWRVPPISIKTK